MLSCSRPSNIACIYLPVRSFKKIFFFFNLKFHLKFLLINCPSHGLTFSDCDILSLWNASALILNASISLHVHQLQIEQNLKDW